MQRITNQKEITTLTSWLDKWESEGTPDWWLHKQVWQHSCLYRESIYNSKATPEELITGKDIVEDIQAVCIFHKRFEAMYPGYKQRLNEHYEAYKRLRGFDPMSKEDMMCKNSEEVERYKSICDSNKSKILTECNNVFASNVFKVPEVVEVASEEGLF